MSGLKIAKAWVSDRFLSSRLKITYLLVRSAPSVSSVVRQKNRYSSTRKGVICILSIVLSAVLTSLPATPAALLIQQSQTQPQNDRQTLADQLLKQGIEYYQANNFEAALKSWQQALSLYQQLQNRRGEGFVIENLGLVYQALGDYEKAVDSFQQHLTIARELADRQGEANALGNLGNSNRVLGKYTTALEYHQQSLAIRRELGDRRGEGQILANMGNVYIELGYYQKAIELHQQSLAIAQAVGNRLGAAISLNSLGATYASLGDYEQASQYYEQCLVAVRELGSKAAEGEMLNNLGSIYHVRGELERALNSYQQSLEIARTIGDRRLEGAALGSLGLIYANQEDYANALEYQEKSALVAHEIGDRRMEGLALSNLGDTLWLSGNLTEAERKLRDALNILESLRLGLEESAQVSIFDTQTLHYNILQQILVAQNQPEAALEIAERGRARAFVELLAKRLSSQTVERLQETSLKTQIEPPTIEQIRQIARSQNATLVEYAIIPDDRFLAQGKLKGSESELFIWVVSPQGNVTFRRIDLKPILQQQGNTPKSLKELVNVSRIMQGARIRQGEAARKQLYQLLIEPIAEFLPTEPDARVIFIPQDALFLLSFPALQDESGQYLIEKHTILTAPAIQVLDLTRQQQQRLESQDKQPFQGENLLVVGNPTMPVLKVRDSEQQLAPLPSAEREALAIAQLLNTKAIIGDEATKVDIIQQMPAARLVHLATHGLLDDIKELGVPGAIALAPSKEDDGFLTTGEILNLKLNAELVVLSACHTGQGEITGDGVVGLSRSLIAAGVPSAIVSLWAVPDEPTSLLMIEFYRHLQDNSNKAQALRQAMLSMMKQYPQPYNWAAFTLIGEAE